jgi:hypothetical protein
VPGVILYGRSGDWEQNISERGIRLSAGAIHGEAERWSAADARGGEWREGRAVEREELASEDQVNRRAIQTTRRQDPDYVWKSFLAGHNEITGTSRLEMDNERAPQTNLRWISLFRNFVRSVTSRGFR